MGMVVVVVHQHLSGPRYKFKLYSGFMLEAVSYDPADNT